MTPEEIMNINIAHNENPIACKKCGGMCCKTIGCEIFPQDVIKWFGSITAENIISMLKSGFVELDWWEGDIRDSDECNLTFDNKYDEYYQKCYYLHMRSKSDPAIYASWGGCCRMLTENGCGLSWDYRPTGGKGLIPDINGDWHNCIQTNAKKEFCVIAWLPYQKILKDVMNNFTCSHINGVLFTLNAISDEYPECIDVKHIKTENDMRIALGITTQDH